MKPNADLKKLFKKPILAYEKFHALTNKKFKLQKEVPLDQWPEEWKKIYYKGYPRLDSIRLPKKHLPNMSLEKTLKQRISDRSFSQKKLTLQELGSLFLYAAGLRSKTTHRYYPSAGARFPLELYFISTNTVLPNGIYHYYVLSHCLEQLSIFETFNYDLYVDQPWIKGAGGLLIISSLFKRTTNKYRNRGYRYTVCESGHLGQNIQLVSACLNLACCGIGGFEDRKINRLLDIEGTEESSLYCFAIGNKV